QRAVRPRDRPAGAVQPDPRAGASRAHRGDAGPALGPAGGDGRHARAGAAGQLAGRGAEAAVIRRLAAVAGGALLGAAAVLLALRAVEPVERAGTPAAAPASGQASSAVVAPEAAV